MQRSGSSLLESVPKRLVRQWVERVPHFLQWPPQGGFRRGSKLVAGEIEQRLLPTTAVLEREQLACEKRRRIVAAGNLFEIDCEL